jgi:hypothetical protein
VQELEHGLVERFRVVAAPSRGPSVKAPVARQVIAEGKREQQYAVHVVMHRWRKNGCTGASQCLFDDMN